MQGFSENKYSYLDKEIIFNPDWLIYIYSVLLSQHITTIVN